MLDFGDRTLIKGDFFPRANLRFNSSQQNFNPVSNNQTGALPKLSGLALDVDRNSSNYGSPTTDPRRVGDRAQRYHVHPTRWWNRPQGGQREGPSKPCCQVFDLTPQLQASLTLTLPESTMLSILMTSSNLDFNMHAASVLQSRTNSRSFSSGRMLNNRTV